MYLEIHDVKDYGSKLVFKLEYDDEFRRAVAKIIGTQHASKKEVQEFILQTLEKNIDFDDFNT